MNRQHMQAVKQVFTKTPVTHHLQQIARGGGHHAHVKTHNLVRAQWLNLALLQGPQQLGLQAQRHVADFVQKQGAAIGQLELARARLALGAGVGAGGNAKKLSLQQGSGNGSNVDGDKRCRGAGRRSMDGMRQQFFASPCFAQQQHRAQRLGSAARLAFDFHRRGATADKIGKAVFGTALAATAAQAAVALGGQLVPGLIKITLHQGKFADQRLQRGLGLIEQHNADGADHRPDFIQQRQAADDKGAGAVRQQVNQHRLASLQHTPHLGVGNDVFDHVTEKIIHRGHAKARQKAHITVVDPDNAPGLIHQKHALAHGREQLEHGTRRQGVDAIRI